MRMHQGSRGIIATKERTGRKKAPKRSKVTFTPMPEFMYQSDDPPPCAAQPDLFNHSFGGSKGVAHDRAAVAICKGCPFRVPCDAWATENRMSGVWGARSANDRAAARRKARGGYPCKSAAQSS